MYKDYELVQRLLLDLKDTYPIITNITLKFYRQRINNFLIEYMGLENNINRPLNTITYFDINEYLDNLQCTDSEKINYYNSFKRFFEYTFLRNETNEIMNRVDIPIKIIKKKNYISEIDNIKLRDFIFNPNNILIERLILGLFLFTGLSRKYIANLNKSQIISENNEYRLKIYKDKEECILPLKLELQELLDSYLKVNTDIENLSKLFPYNENNLSKIVANFARQITGNEYTPTDFSNSFIKNALGNTNYIWEISHLTLESVTTIDQHIYDYDKLYDRQKKILESI
jgi:integrase